MRHLLDSNALIALCVPDHIHHPSIRSWLTSFPDFAVCPITEGALARFIMRTYKDQPDLVTETIQALSRVQGCHFWPDDVSYQKVDFARISGHNQVTDAYLVSLASSHGGTVATFDGAMAIIHREAKLIPYLT